ncbi:peptidase C14, caspase domain-containing protein [Armillaria novae-zelandiae]|uniref:Peptidase C14, caspase domain-containing protein n=1 Tax=Armillaria novae-zelandiae TaxID=153914 RepID=A0AA39U4V1_9AGAR|nr:peptidase C14, caspase domain-containing protein [Armillaria novae-zelandiae]
MSQPRYPVYHDRHQAAHRVDANHFWAVLIGIDGYNSSPLRGCVADVEKMKDFLTVDLGVPEDHIRCLVSRQPLARSIGTASHLRRVAESYSHYIATWCSETSLSQDHHTDDAANSPTRANIVDALLSLSVDPRVLQGDNIIIYFSGHGSTYFCADYYTDEIEITGCIEAICPVDRAPRNSFLGSIPDISDREFNTILAEISRTKGHHITCILDCCHSSSATRDPNDQSYRVRSARPLPPVSIHDMLDAAHRRLKGLKNYRNIHDGDWSPDMTTHVILAACQETEHAKEHERENGCNGIFTQALVEALKSDRLNAGSTYRDLIHTLRLLPSTAQVPVVAGRHIDERLWYTV